jgi:hypothetical protein
MLPLDIVFFLVVGIWGLIGAARTFTKEVGATISIILAMAGMSIFGPMLIDTFNTVASKLSLSMRIPVAAVPTGAQAFCYSASQEQFFFYLIGFAVVVFMGYQGDTLSLNQSVGRITGSVMGLGIGLVNGWLVAGNLWYFLGQCANYTVPALGINSVGVLDPTAATLWKLLPFNTIGSPLMLVGILLVLMLLRIAK